MEHPLGSFWWQKASGKPAKLPKYAHSLDRRAVRERCQGVAVLSPVPPRTVPALPHKDALRALRICTVNRKGRGARENAEALQKLNESMREVDLAPVAKYGALQKRTKLPVVE